MSTLPSAFHNHTFNPRYFSEGATLAGGGAICDWPALESARVNAAALGGVVEFTSGTYRLSKSIAYDRNIRLRFLPGAVIVPDPGVIVTINGELDAGPHRVFDIDRGGSIVIAPHAVREFLPEWWGAVGDPAVNDIKAFRQCAAAVPWRCHMAARGTYRLGGAGEDIPVAGVNEYALLTFTRGITFTARLLLIDPDVTSVTDILRISPASNSDTDHRDFHFEDITIQAISGRPGRHALALDYRRTALAYSHLKRSAFYQLGGRGVVGMPHPRKPLIDGLFQFDIDTNVIYGGIYLDKSGDSIRIKDCVVAGTGVSIYLDSVRAAEFNTPHGNIFTGNTLISTGGYLRVKNSEGLRFSRNIMECQHVPVGVSNNAMIDIDGVAPTVVAGQNQSIIVSENTMNGYPGYDMIRVNRSRRTQIMFNQLNEPGGGGYLYNLTDTAVDTDVILNNPSGDSVLATHFRAKGTRTNVIQNGLADSVDFWRHITLREPDKRIKGVDSAGTPIPILGVVAANNTVVVGAQAPMASNGQLQLWAGNAEAVEIQPTRNATFRAGTGSPEVGVPYSAAMTINAAAGDSHSISGTNGTPFTINAPTNPLPGHLLEITIRNVSGRTLGTATWNAVFKMAPWTQPANGFSRTILFRYDGTHWVERTRGAVDIPN
jgi:hypothetical protein